MVVTYTHLQVATHVHVSQVIANIVNYANSWNDHCHNCTELQPPTLLVAFQTFIKNISLLQSVSITEVKPFLEQLLTNLFGVLDVPGSQENEYIMKCKLRVLICGSCFLSISLQRSRSVVPRVHPWHLVYFKVQSSQSKNNVVVAR